MPVYFIGEDDKGCSPIKIGVTRDIAKRKRSLQTGNSSILKLMGWIVSEDDSVLEKSLHSHFSRRYARGEWFDIEAADILPFLMKAALLSDCR